MSHSEVVETILAHSMLRQGVIDEVEPAEATGIEARS